MTRLEEKLTSRNVYNQVQLSCGIHHGKHEQSAPRGDSQTKAKNKVSVPVKILA